jgi:aspartyl protease family protein
MSARPDLPRGWKIATVWLLIGLTLFLLVQAWLNHAAQTRFTVQAGVVAIRRSPDGHFHWPGRVAGREVDFLIDTGATSTVLPGHLVQGLDLTTLGEVRTQTANGSATGRLVQADLMLQGGIQIERLRVTVLPGHSGPPLLGMDVMGRLRWQQDAGVLRIRAAAP